jgi:flagellar hook-associated protein 3 FlgL
MRVATSTFPNALASQLEQLSVRQNRLQLQVATGQRLQLPDDDPAAMRRVLDLQAERRVVAQHQRNIAREQGQARVTFAAIKSLKTISDRANEIATLAGGVRSPRDLKVYAVEVAQLLQQALQLANTKHQGEFLFGGTQSDQPPFVATTDSSGAVTSVGYRGNEQVAETEIAEGVTLSTQAPGASMSGSGPHGLLAEPRAGADLFSHLLSLQNHLASGDTEAIAKIDRPQLQRDEDHFIAHLGTAGAIQSRLETAGAMAGDRLASLGQLVSGEADADLAQTLVRLSQTQNAYRAALQSGATILDRSLLDYLR